MTRVEPPVPSAPKQRFRLGVPKFSLRRFFALILIVALFWVGVLIARTGVVHLPFFSAAFYTPPTPRAVTAGQERGDVAQRFTALTSGTVVVTNAELTALAQGGADHLHLGLANVQVVGGTTNSLELSCIVPQRNNAIVRMDLVPTVADGTLSFQVDRTSIGMVDVPVWLIGEPTRLLLTAQLAFLLKATSPVTSAAVTETGLVLHF